MSRAIMAFWLISTLLLTARDVKGQDFDYTLSHDSVAYQELSSPVMIAEDTIWNSQSFTVPIGFSFSAMDSTFDTLTIETNGYLVLDDQHNYAITAFKEMVCKPDSIGGYSTLSYKLSGSAGNHILKIQYKNCGVENDDSAHYFNYQVWLYEQNGAIEIHVGPHTYAADSLYTPLVGILNMNMNTPVTAFLAQGDPANPTGQPISPGSNLVYLDLLPSENNVYVFTPAN